MYFEFVGATCGRPRAFTERPYGVVVRICPRICFCGESISKNAFRWFESVYRPEMTEMHLQNFEKLHSRKKRRNLSKSPLLVCSPPVGLAFLRKSHGGKKPIQGFFRTRLSSPSIYEPKQKTTVGVVFCFVTCVRFRCKTVCGQFRCTRILQRVDEPLGDDGSCT